MIGEVEQEKKAIVAEVEPLRELKTGIDEIDTTGTKLPFGVVAIKKKDLEAVKEQAKAYTANRDEIGELRERSAAVSRREQRADQREQHLNNKSDELARGACRSRVSKSNTKVLQRIKSLTECKSKNKTSGITSKTAVQTSEKPKSELDCSSTIPKSRLLKNRSLDFDKAEVLTSENQSYIHTEINHTENSNTYPSIYHITETNGKSQPKSENPSSDGLIARSNPNSEISIYKNAVAETQLQISYMYLLTNHQSKKGYLDLIVSLIAEVYVSAYTHPTTSVTINGIKTSIGIVADRLKTIDESHIEYLFEKIDASANTKQIKNPRSYLLSCLYNAPATATASADVPKTAQS